MNLWGTIHIWGSPEHNEYGFGTSNFRVTIYKTDPHNIVKETIQFITVKYFNHLKYHHQWRLSKEIKTVGEILLFDNFDIFIEL